MVEAAVAEPEAEPVAEEGAVVVARVEVLEAALELVVEDAPRIIVPQVAFALQLFWASRSFGLLSMHWP